MGGYVKANPFRRRFPKPTLADQPKFRITIGLKISAFWIVSAIFSGASPSQYDWIDHNKNVLFKASVS
jgi:hypothetical protein